MAPHTPIGARPCAVTTKVKTWYTPRRIVKHCFPFQPNDHDRIPGKRDSTNQSEALGDALLPEADGNDGGRRDSLRMSVDTDLDDSWADDSSVGAKKKCVVISVFSFFFGWDTEVFAKPGRGSGVIWGYKYGGSCFLCSVSTCFFN